MTTSRCTSVRGTLLCCLLIAQAFAADPALTIYNQNFAVVRESLPLDLKAGSNKLEFSGVTSQVEPDSVILRDPAARHFFQVTEQNYRNDVVTQQLLLSLFEGKTIDFITGAVPEQTVQGKIIRSGYAPRNRQNGTEPIIEVAGKLRFTLPGQPLFPALADDTILKPALNWTIFANQAAQFNAELSYVTGGLSWKSDYNLVAPETGDALDLVGWVTLDNESGKPFDHAQIKLMAGTVNKIQQQTNGFVYAATGELASSVATPQVTQREFEDYHLYTLPQAITLHDRETKQVEFLQASGVQSKRFYLYDGLKGNRNYNGQDLRQFQQYGAEFNPNVWIMREFVNSAANHLGVPLPAGRLRFYRRDQDGQLEFTGENEINHTAKDETIQVYTGNAFDIAGERRQTSFRTNNNGSSGSIDEAFEIKLRNHKQEATTVRVVEHLYRWSNWLIWEESAPHRAIDSRTIEYEVALQPNEEKVVTYKVNYTW